MSKVNKYLGYVGIGMITVFILAPIIIIIPVSFVANNMFTFSPDELSLANYKALLNDGRMLESVWLSIYVGVVAVVVASLVGLMSALGIVKGSLPFKGALESFF